MNMSLEMGKTGEIEIDIRKKFIYGTLGIAMSFVGFLIWIWAFMEKTGEHLIMFLSFGRMFGLNILPNLPNSLTGIVVTKAALLGLASILAILAPLWVIGYWKGENKLLVTDFVSRMGITHYYIGVGYLVATMTILIDWKLSIVVVLINILLGGLLAFVLASNIFIIRAQRVFSFVSLSLGSSIMLLILFVIFLF